MQCMVVKKKLEGHSVERMYLRQSCSDGSVNARVAATTGGQYVHFPDVIKFRVAALIRYRRKQSGFGIRTIIRIGLKN